MRIGLSIDDRGLAHDDLVAEVRDAAAAGFAGFWLGQHTAGDALTSLAVAGSAAPGIGVGTAVVPTYPRHPLALAAQALTVQAATGNRLDLGLGTSHRMIIEGQLGYSFDKPARHLREYLTVLRPLLRGESVDFRGETLTAAGQLGIPGATAPSLLVAALGPVMLRVAGELADGTITVWAGANALDKHVLPELLRTATDPRVVAMVSVCVTADEADARPVRRQVQRGGEPAQLSGDAGPGRRCRAGRTGGHRGRGLGGAPAASVGYGGCDGADRGPLRHGRRTAANP
jgi:F420-dependent oxidoreductase-like protein